MKAVCVVLIMVWPIFAFAQESTSTNTEAREAQSMLEGAYALHARVAEICEDASAMGLLYDVAEETLKKLDGWQEQKNQNLTSYSSCRQSMVDVQSYAYTCAQGGYKGKAVTYMQRRWAEDIANCTEAIRVSTVQGSGRN